MSYLVFHLVLILPPILLMAATLPSSLNDLGGWRARIALPLIALIALTYTTAWDNYLVARDVWWYGPGRVLATIGFVPVEEYLFFVLQPVLTGLGTAPFRGVARGRPGPGFSRSPRSPAGASCSSADSRGSCTSDWC